VPSRKGWGNFRLKGEGRNGLMEKSWYLRYRQLYQKGRGVHGESMVFHGAQGGDVEGLRTGHLRGTICCGGKNGPNESWVEGGTTRSEWRLYNGDGGATNRGKTWGSARGAVVSR